MLSGVLATWEYYQRVFVRVIQERKHRNSPGPLFLPRTRTRRTGIVIQGPVVTREDFTVETALQYRYRYPDAGIVVSTWQDAQCPNESRLCRAGIHILRSPLPKTAGLANVNYQIVSTLAGLRWLANQGVLFAIKTRSDQRICNPYALEYLHFLLDIHPLEKTVDDQRNRIVGCSYLTNLYRPYDLCDFLYFGNISDLQDFFDCPFDERILDKQVIQTARTNWDFAQINGAGSYLLTSWLQRKGHAVKRSLEDYWQVLTDRFCIIDRDTIQLLWLKYGRNHHRDLAMGWIHECRREVTYMDWLMLRSGQTGSFGGEEFMRCDIFSHPEV